MLKKATAQSRSPEESLQKGIERKFFGFVEGDISH